MTTQTHSLQLHIDAKKAKAGSDQFVSALRGIKQEIASLERASDGTFTNLKKGMQVTKSAKGPEAALNGITKASTRAEQASQRLATATTNAMTTAESASSRLRNQFTEMGNVTGLQRAEAALASLQSRAAKATTVGDVSSARADYRAAVTGLQSESRAAQMAEKSQSAHAREVENLKSEFIALYAPSKAYESALNRITAAEREGILTTTQASQARERAAQALSGAVDTNTAALQRNAASTQQGIMVGHQLSDVLITSQMGFQSVGMIALQQGSQLAAQMNTLKASGGSVFATLLSGFTSMLNPLSLITIGAVAAGAAIAKWFFAAGGEALSLSDAMDNLKESTTGVADAVERTSTGWSSVRRDYGEITKEVMSLVAAQRMLAQITASNDLQAARDALFNEQGKAGWFDALAGYADNAKGRIRLLRDEFDLTKDSAARFEALFAQSRTETSASGLAGIFARMRRELEGATNGFVDMSPERQKLLEDLVASEDAARRLAAVTGDIAPGITAAANEASRLSAELIRGINLRNRADASTQGGRGTINRWNYREPDAGRLDVDDVLAAARKREQDALRAAKKSGSKRESISDIQRYTQSVQAQSIALRALQDGLFETTSASQAYAAAMIEGGGAVDSATMAALKQADAVASANEQLRKIVQTNKSGGLKEATEEGIRGGLKSGLAAAMRGDTASFAASLADSVYNSLSNAIADALTNQLFAKNVGGGVGGGFFSFISGIFGAGSEGGYSETLPGRSVMPLASFKNAPQYAEGTANTSNAIPAVLHPNEAVVPLSRGRKIPVDIGDGGGKSVAIGDIVTNVTVESDGGGADDAVKIARAVSESVDGRVRTILAEEMSYGGIANPRGGL